MRRLRRGAPGTPSRAATVLLFLTLLCAACGTGTAGPGAGNHFTPATLQAADAVCAPLVRWYAGHPFPVTGFDAGNPDAAQLPAVADYYAAVPLEATAAALGALAVPAQDTTRWHALTTAVGRYRANAAVQVTAARRGDAAAFARTARTAATLYQKVARQVADGGFTDPAGCAGAFG